MSKIPIPVDGTELEEILNDSKRLAEIFATPADAGEFIRNYATAHAKRNGAELSGQIKEQVQIALAEMLDRNDGRLRNGRTAESILSAPRRGVPSSSHAPGSALDGQFRDRRDFMASVHPKHFDHARWQKIRNDYSTVTPDAGGFLVPETIREGLLVASLEKALVRPRATVVEMDAPIVSFPAIDETTHVDSVFGGVSTTWVAEGEPLPESQARFRRVKLAVNKLVTYCEAPSELPLDAPRAFGSFIDTAMPNAIAWGEDLGCLTGNGAGKPLGALHANNTALIEVAKETNQVADTIVWQNIVKMFSRMLPSSLGSAIWLFPPDAFPQLAQMALAVGTGGGPVWLNNGAEGPPGTVLGRPFFLTEKTYKLGDRADAAFVDFGSYLFGDLQQMRVTASEHYKFGNDVIAYRVIERADGRPAQVSPLTPANGSTATLSPFVCLAERA